MSVEAQQSSESEPAVSVRREAEWFSPRHGGPSGGGAPSGAHARHASGSAPAAAVRPRAGAFPRVVFTLAGLYGLAVVLPLYFLEARLGVEQPPAINHPEYYYGFAGVTLAWQLLFLVTGRNPEALRPAMLVGVVEKLAFVGAIVALWNAQRVGQPVLVMAGVDLLWALLFLLARAKTPASG